MKLRTAEEVRDQKLAQVGPKWPNAGTVVNRVRGQASSLKETHRLCNSSNMETAPQAYNESKTGGSRKPTQRGRVPTHLRPGHARREVLGRKVECCATQPVRRNSNVTNM
jgi:hypothetical protein